MSYLALTNGRRYCLDGSDQDPPDWHELHVALSRLPRFHGYSRVSVLRHALAVHRLLGEQGYEGATLRLGFLHDHHEALVGDVPSPIKALLGDRWEAIEAPAAAYVRRWFDLEGADEAAVRAADVGMLRAEAVHQGIARFGDGWLGDYSEADHLRLSPMLSTVYDGGIVAYADDLLHSMRVLRVGDGY